MSSMPPVAPPAPDDAARPCAAQVLAETRAWVDHAVIGLNLCPFAKAPQVKGLVRYALSEATTAEALTDDLLRELRLLADADPEAVETTVLVLPRMMADFHDFNDYLAVADAALETLGLEGELQVASFHPAYQFADAAPDDITNATNQSPWPALHLIREASIDRAVAAIPDAESIYRVNMATMRRLGDAGWQALKDRCREEALAATAADGPAAKPRANA